MSGVQSFLGATANDRVLVASEFSSRIYLPNPRTELGFTRQKQVSLTLLRDT